MDNTDVPMPAQPPRQTQAAVDSDDDVEIFDYQQSRQGGRLRRRSEAQDVQRERQQSHQDARSHHGDASPHELSDADSEDAEGSRHPFYSYATEKSDVQTDAKLFYQRLKLDTKSGSESGGSPHLLAKSFTMPSGGYLDGNVGLGRSPSLSGRRPSSRTNSKILTSTLGQPAMRLPHGRESFPAVQDANVAQRELLRKLDTAAGFGPQDDAPAFKDPMLAHEGVTGAGAALGVGTATGAGVGGFAMNEGEMLSEIEAICDKIKHILDLRHGYMKVSNQCPGDNPKDAENWAVYPAPPEPVWSEDKIRAQRKKEDPSGSASVSASSSLYIADPKSVGKDGIKFASTTSASGLTHEQVPLSPSTAKKPRKAGTAIGSDFDMNECVIPGKAAVPLTFGLDKGSIFQVYDQHNEAIVSVPTLRDYYKALDEVLEIASDGPAKSFAYRRLQYLEGRFRLYTLLNEYEEVAETKSVPHRDFYNVRKVDTHVHHSACMNQKHLLRFIKSKMKRNPDEKVLERDGKQLTLSEVFESINLTAYDLSIDTLDMHAHTDSFHRFDKFNLKYNPVGQSRLRDIFLKTDNFVKGRYLADITREVIADLESSKYQMVEWRISIYGRSMEEWDKLAAWVVDNKLFSPNVRWLIQIPRLFSLYKSLNTMQNFEQLLQNIFLPLFEVTQDPSSHPKLHIFLQRVIGFDCVDDESKPEKRLHRKYPAPKQWNTKQNPPYGYWIYYLFANMTSLNAWRKRRNFNTFLLRPHCGEAGDIDHLAAAVLCCHSISHGITLRKVPLLQYIFYLDQIGIAMSPLSNNALFLTYDRNPFISYFKKGLNVSLSTDDPLQFAFTKEPLIEEYSVAAQIYKLSAIDMCELAKHSVDQCGFELQLKQRWLGKYCYLPGVMGNDVRKSNVPNRREAFRHETLKAEHGFISNYTDEYTHLERCSLDMPPLSDPATPIGDVLKTLESPSQYYATIADSIPPFALARKRGSSRASSTQYQQGSSSRLSEQYPSNPSQAYTRSPTLLQGAADVQNHHHHNSSKWSNGVIQQRDRAGSRSSVHSRPQLMSEVTDPLISGQEPRAFPGMLAQTEKKRSLTLSSLHGAGATKDNNVTGNISFGTAITDGAMEAAEAVEDTKAATPASEVPNGSGGIPDHVPSTAVESSNGGIGLDGLGIREDKIDEEEESTRNKD